MAGLMMGAIGVAITLAAWVGVERANERRLQARFHEIAAVRAERIGYELDRYRDDLLNLAGFVATAPDLDGRTFHRLAHARTESMRGLQSVAWLVAPAGGSYAQSAVRLRASGAGPD